MFLDLPIIQSENVFLWIFFFLVYFHYSGKKLPPPEVDGLEKKERPVWKWHGLSNQMGVCICLGGDLGVL